MYSPSLICNSLNLAMDFPFVAVNLGLKENRFFCCGYFEYFVVVLLLMLQ